MAAASESPGQQGWDRDRTGDIDIVYKPATVYWSYNGCISYVTQPRTPKTDTVLTWADFATGQSLDSNDWTLPEP